MKSPKVEQRARPFVKWAGGKTQLLPEILARVPKSWDRERDLYAEPFVGSGAVYFGLRPLRAVLNDANPDLAACWRALQYATPAVVSLLRELENKYRKDPSKTYYDVRDDVEPGQDVTEVAARLIFLNKTCFNGLHRVNKSGKFNVPWGQNLTAVVLDEENLRLCGELLREGSVTITSDDFARRRKYPAGTLVYLDPPYPPRSKTANFTSFTSRKFDRPDHERLARYAGRLADEGCHVVVSQSDDEDTLELYRKLGFTCDLVPAIRKINSQGHRRGIVCESIIYREAT